MEELPATFGKYYLTEKLATGGMAEIYLGKILGPGGFEKKLVIKQIHPRLTGQRQFVDMFVAEAKTLVGLTHGNIVPVYELGVVDDIYFIAMEYIDGPTLYRFTEAAARRGLQLPTAIAAWIAAEILEGLDYAHRKGTGVIHRDLSPRNVMLSRDGEVKLVDFGIAVSLGASGESAGSAPTGSFPYMSPEQVRREALDGQSDLFSVGVLLWEMLTGQRLFARANPEDTLAAVLESDVLLPSTLRSSVPARLDETVAIALNRTKDQRWDTAGDMLAALNRHLYSLDKAPSARDLAPLVARLCPPERRSQTEGGVERAEPHAPGAVPTPDRPDAPSTAVMARDGTESVARPIAVRSFATNVGWKQLLDNATPLLGTPAILGLADTTLPSTMATPEAGPAPPARSVGPSASRLPRRVLIAVGLALAAASGVWARLACTGEPATVDAQVAASDAAGEASVAVARDATADADADAPRFDAAPTGRDARPRRLDALAVRAPSDARPPRRADAATAERGFLKVGAIPWGNVFLDGKKLGTAPRTWEVPVGKHELVVEFPASDPPQREARRIDITFGVVTTESFRFTP